MTKKKLNQVKCQVLKNAYVKVGKDVSLDGGKTFVCDLKKATELARRGLVTILSDNIEEEALEPERMQPSDDVEDELVE